VIADSRQIRIPPWQARVPYYNTIGGARPRAGQERLARLDAVYD